MSCETLGGMSCEQMRCDSMWDIGHVIFKVTN